MTQRLNSSGIDLNQNDNLPAGTLITDDTNHLRIYDGVNAGGNLVVGGGSTGDITFVGSTMELFDTSPAIITSNVSFFVNDTLTVNGSVGFIFESNLVIRQEYNSVTNSLDTVFV